MLDVLVVSKRGYPSGGLGTLLPRLRGVGEGGVGIYMFIKRASSFNQHNLKLMTNAPGRCSQCVFP